LVVPFLFSTDLCLWVGLLKTRAVRGGGVV
jgi:hypothetical protein